MIEKPQEVRKAVILLWVSLAVMPIRMAADWATTKAILNDALALTVLVATIAVLSFLIWQISRGKNGARLVFLVLYLLGVPFSLYALPTDFGRSPMVAVCSLAQILLQGAGLWMISRAPGKDWFTDPRPAEASVPSIRA